MVKKLKMNLVATKIKASQKITKLVIGACATLGLPITAFASNNETPPSSSTKTSDDIITTIGDYAFTIFKYIGFVLLIWGTGQFVMAYRNDDSDSKIRAIMCVAVGAILFGLKAAFDTFGISL